MKITIKYSIILCTMLALGCTEEVANETQPEETPLTTGLSSDSTAELALSYFAHMITATDYELMGFQRMSQLDSLALIGPPMVSFALTSKGIANNNAPTLTQDTVQVVYQVGVEGDTIPNCQMELIYAENTWYVVSLGNAGEASAIATARLRHAQKHQRPASDYFLVDAPEMYTRFIGYYNEDELMLIPLQDQPQYGLAKTVPVAYSNIAPTLLDAMTNMPEALVKVP